MTEFPRGLRKQRRLRARSIMAFSKRASFQMWSSMPKGERFSVHQLGPVDRKLESVRGFFAPGCAGEFFTAWHASECRGIQNSVILP